MRILVTGAAGFIGSEFLVQLTANGEYEITVIDSLTYAGRLENLNEVKNKIKFEKLDIRNRQDLGELFKNSNFDKVVHFAAESHVDNSISNPNIFLETNVFGTQNLIEMSIKYGVTEFLHVSTDEVYGSLVSGFASEEDSFNPASPYSASKAAAEHFVNAAKHTFNLNTKIVRCSNNYGPRQYPEKLIPFFISKIDKGENVTLYGTGKNIREWIHVSDCAAGIILVLNSEKPNEIYNISSGQFYSNVQVAGLILSHFGLDDSKISYIEDRKGHDFRYAINSKKITDELGWVPKIDFNHGLIDTIDWYSRNEWALQKKINA
jgi:dTDP-glucose 4,6-dehydratase